MRRGFYVLLVFLGLGILACFLPWYAAESKKCEITRSALRQLDDQGAVIISHSYWFGCGTIGISSEKVGMWDTVTIRLSYGWKGTSEDLNHLSDINNLHAVVVKEDAANVPLETVLELQKKLPYVWFHYWDNEPVRLQQKQ